jgi:hypothetical protein
MLLRLSNNNKYECVCVKISIMRQLLANIKSSTERLYSPNLTNIIQTWLLPIVLHKYPFRSVLYSRFPESLRFQQGMPDSPEYHFNYKEELYKQHSSLKY